jgi:hypothetical protein
MKIVLFLDSANSLGPNNGQCQFALNQGIVGAVSCTVLSLNFTNSIANTALNFNSAALTPSDKRFVGCLSNTQPLSCPLFSYILQDPGAGNFEGTNSNQFPSRFALSGQGFNFLDMTITDAASGAIVTGMTPWTMLLEFDVPIWK